MSTDEAVAAAEGGAADAIIAGAALGAALTVGRCFIAAVKAAAADMGSLLFMGLPNGPCPISHLDAISMASVALMALVLLSSIRVSS